MRPEENPKSYRGNLNKINNFICLLLFFSHSSQFSETENQSLSILTFVPTVEDDGKYLTCRAENPSIPNSAIEDKWRLVVQCKYMTWEYLVIDECLGKCNRTNRIESDLILWLIILLFHFQPSLGTITCRHANCNTEDGLFSKSGRYQGRWWCLLWVWHPFESQAPPKGVVSQCNFQ